MTTIPPIGPNDPEAKSADIVTGNIEALKALFPDALTEGRIDFEVLKGLLGGAVDERDEKYGLNWHGKRRARQIALTPSTGTLLPCPEESVDWDTTQNLMIEGDNLEVLKLLQKSYTGKVKMIYIDPPYNTGKDFVYPDDFRDSIKNYLQLTGQVEGSQKLSSNTEASGRFHTVWLNMTYPRLRLARTMLREDGVLFISIDDGEIENLKLICAEIFGQENYIGTIVRKTKLTSNKGTHFAPSHEYILAFAKDIENLAEFSDPEALEDEDYIKLFRFTDTQGKYNEVSLYMPSLDPMRGCANQRYYIECPDGSLVIPPGGNFPAKAERGAQIKPSSNNDKVWRWKNDTFLQKLSENRVVFKETNTSPLLDQNGKKSKWNIYTKIYLHERQETGMRPNTLFDKYPNSAASKLLIKIGIPFPFSKPIEIIGWLQKICDVKGDDIVMDFFSGSGTTGHSVMQRNALTNNNIRYFLVQLPKVLNANDSNESTAAEFCDQIRRPKNIAELTKERLRRAGKMIRDEHALFKGDTGFRVFKLASSNIRAWDADPADLGNSLLKNAEHLVQGRKEQDVLYELLLKLGLDLCVPIETKTIAGKAVHSIGGGALIACLADGLTKDVIEKLGSGIVAWRAALAPAVDTRIVFKDSGFADDIAKTNMAAILNQNGISDVRSL